MRRWPAMLWAGAMLCGCVADGPRSAPPPHQAPAQPSGLQADKLVATATQIPDDSDRNGYYDTTLVTVYLYGSGFDLPIHVPGAFTFRLTDARGKQVALWVFDEARTDAARCRTMVGPGYQFRLDLLDVGTDKFPASEGQLHTSFAPREGATVQPRGGTTVLIGPTR